MIIQEQEYLAHVGVMGMKWGHHKRAESDRITRARATVEKNKQNLKSAKKNYNKQTMYGIVTPSKKSTGTLNKAKREHKYSKIDLKGAKILDKLNSKEKSKAQLAGEEKYKAKGMSKDEAAIAAYQHIRNKKILIGMGVTAAVLGSAYAGYKIHDARVDKIIKSGTLLQTISSDPMKGVNDAFYSSTNKLDQAKYKGLFGSHLKESNGHAFKKQVEVLSDIKQASRKNAQATLSELMKNDSDFAGKFKEYVNSSTGLVNNNTMGKAQASLSKGVVDKHVYDLFNVALVDHSSDMQGMTNKYFNELSKKGYNALRDVNDVKFSGYKSINPIIAFNTKGIVDVVDIKKLSETEMKKAGKIAYTSIFGSDLVKKGTVIATGVLAANSVSSAIKNKSDSVKIKKYRDENSNSKLTNTEIIRMLERGK